MYGGFAHGEWKSKERWLQIAGATIVLWILMTLHEMGKEDTPVIDTCSTGISQDCNNPEEAQIPIP